MPQINRISFFKLEANCMMALTLIFRLITSFSFIIYFQLQKNSVSWKCSMLFERNSTSDRLIRLIECSYKVVTFQFFWRCYTFSMLSFHENVIEPIHNRIESPDKLRMSKIKVSIYHFVCFAVFKLIFSVLIY